MLCLNGMQLEAVLLGFNLLNLIHKANHINENNHVYRKNLAGPQKPLVQPFSTIMVDLTKCTQAEAISEKNNQKASTSERLRWPENPGFMERKAEGNMRLDSMREGLIGRRVHHVEVKPY